MNKIKLLSFSVLSGVLLFGDSSIASPAVDSLPGVIDRGAPEIQVPKGYKLDDEVAKPLKDAPELDAPANGGEIVANLDKVNFKGLSVISTSLIDKAVAPYLSRDLTKLDIAKLKHDLTRLFYDAGYILVKVVTPPQDLSDGVLDVEIYEAKIGTLDIKNDVINPRIAESISHRISKGDVFFEDSVESVVSDINDLNNVRASVNLRPGAAFGETDLLLTVNKADEEVQRVTVDNYGSELTGEIVAAAHLEKNNLLNLGEKISLDVRRSEDQLWSLGGRVVSPIGISNYNIEASYLFSRNEIGDRLSVLGASGQTSVFGVALSKNLYNVRDTKATFKLGLDVREHESFEDATTGREITTSKDEISQAYANLSYLSRGNEAVIFASVRVSTGVDLFGANNQGSASASNPNGDPDAWIINPSIYVNALSPFTDGSIKFIGSAQLATNELLSSDLFVLGGYGSVRGFNPAYETGEAGYSFSIEYQHNLPPIGESWDVSVGPFFDGGTVLNREVAAVDRDLYAAGLGIEAKADLTDVGTTKVRFDWAHPLGNYKSNEVDNDTFYLRLSQEF